MDASRRLIHIPIVHNAADLGSLAESVRAHYARVCGPAGWRRREEALRALWGDIEAGLDALRLDARKTRIYQDGLPICGFEEQIVRELANAGSSNHQLILRWLDAGAALMGTEDSRLLMEEYEIQKQRLSPTNKTPTIGEQERLDALLKARDSFIVRRIADTLRADEVGLLFLGALHRLDVPQASGIRVEGLG
jgi:hypothetical protein